MSMIRILQLTALALGIKELYHALEYHGFAIGILIAIRRNHQMKKSGEIVFKIVKRG